MTLVLLIGAGLLARSFQRLLEVDPGFRIDNSVALEISRSRPRNREERLRLASFLDRTIQTLEQLPGIQQVGGVNSFPLGSNFSNGQFLVEKSYQEWAFALDQAPDWERFGQLAETSEKGYAEYRLASEGYFATMGIALLQGRLFESTDSPESAHVGVISQSLAGPTGLREYFPARTLSPCRERDQPVFGRDPLGGSAGVLARKNPLATNHEVRCARQSCYLFGAGPPHPVWWKARGESLKGSAVQRRPPVLDGNFLAFQFNSYGFTGGHLAKCTAYRQQQHSKKDSQLRFPHFSSPLAWFAAPL